MIEHPVPFILGTVVLAALVFGAAFPVVGVAGEPAVASRPPGHEIGGTKRRYGGRTLKEWQEYIKETPHDVLANPETIDGLIEIMQDRDAPWANRRQAALTLGRIGQPAARAVPLLHQLLDSDDEDPQATTLWALKGLALMETVGEPATKKVIQIVLDEGQPHLIRVNALDTLGRIGRNHPQTLPAFQQVLKSTRSQKAAADDTFDPALKELRMTAAAGLWYLKASAAGALPELLQAAQDPWPLLRLEAVITIGGIGPAAEIAVPALVDILLFDEAEEVREAAADALGQIGAASLHAFRQLSDDNDEQVRRLVIRGLSQLPAGVQRRMSPLAGASVSPNQILTAVLEDPSMIVRVEAAAVLIRRERDASAAGRAAMDVLLTELNAPDRATRIIAYRALQEQIDLLEPYRSRLEEMIHDQSIHRQARIAAEHLFKLLAVPDGTGEGAGHNLK